MNPLQFRLAALRRRLRLVVTFRGVAAVTALVLLVLVIGGLLDWRVHLPDLVRALILAGTLSGAGYVAYRHVLSPLWANADDLSLALRVEERYPVLNDALASAVQFLEHPEQTEQSGSPSMRQEAVQRALGLARGFNFNPVVNTRGIRAAGLSLAAAGTLALVLALLYPQLAQTGFLRLAHPFGGYDWPRQTQLDIKARTRVARGEAFEIQATVSGVVPVRAVVEYRFDASPPAREAYEITRPEGAETGKLIARLEPGRVQRNFRLQVRANDALSPWLDIEVLPPPQLAPLGGRPSPQIHLQYPAYSDLPEQDLPDGASGIEAAAGTSVTLRAATDRPIVRAWLEYPDDLAPAVHVASGINALSETALANVLDLAMSRPSIWKRIPAHLAADGKVFQLDFIMRLSGTFALHFEDEVGIGNVRLLEVHTLVDPAPVVHMERPSRSQDSLDILPDADITLHVQAADQLYALRSVHLEYKKGSGVFSGKPGLAQEKTPDSFLGRLVLYDHEAAGETVALFSLMSAGTMPVVVPALRLRTQHLDIERRWSLKDLTLREGDVVTLQACADDFDDVTVLKQPGRSQEVELRVVGKNALDIALNEAEAQIQQELIRLQKEQQEAIEKVIPAETHWRNKGQLQSKHLDELLQAEQIQQQIRARVGTKQEGLRAEVARVQQAQRDNHLPRSARQDRMEAIANELDRLSRDELDQIEPRLTEARKEHEMKETQAGPQGREQKSKSPERNNTNPESKEKAPLAEARRHQEEVKKTLDELLKLLEPWSNSREVKGEARSILQDQQDLQKQTDGLARSTPIEQPERLDANQKADLEKTAELQKKLAERAGKLLDKLRRMAESRPKEDADALAMKQAADKGQQNNATGKMQEAEKNIRDNKLNQAGAQQAESSKAMAEVVEALQDRRDEDLDRLIKKMKQAEDKLADLADRQEALQKKMKDAAQMEDTAQREEALKRLAREQEQLQKDTQEMVRELSRLRSDRARQALSQAGSQMQRASRQMERGQNAEDQQDEALDRLNDAQQELQQDREQAEEELAREKLAKVADMIKGIRERQESLDAEATRIDRQVLQEKRWSRPLQSSQVSLSDAQKGLSEETAALAKDKFGSAKVFAHLLGKSAEAMEQAAEQILKRVRKDEPTENAAAVRENSLNIAAETEAGSETSRLQLLALRRVDQLLEALKQQKGQSLKAGNQKQGGREQGGGAQAGGGGQGGGAGDNIPPLAQIKALKALQEEIHDRTKTFNKKHPDAPKLIAKEQDELKSLRREQQELMDLFREITAPPAEPEGGKK